MKCPNSNKFVLHTVNEDFVFKELSHLNPFKSTGLDNIPARFLKDAAVFLKIPITYIINMSVVENKVPEELKSARVVPLYKKGNKSEVGNFRPVSILSIISKILERAVYSQLKAFLVKNNMLYDLQSGFRGNYSTDTCLIHLTDHIKTQTSKGLYTGMILLDLQKAFDTVDHSILCDKLKAMGIGSVEWFQSYLSDRMQTVQVNDTYSNIEQITCGVPQGSILGPLLFLCYVNDMSLSISSDCKLMLYADDSAILFSHKDVNVISDRLGKELRSCSNWLIDNKLSLHLGKTECILFGSKRNLSKNKVLSINYDNYIIESTSSVKYLGLVLDNTLSSESCANDIIKKVNSRIKCLYRHGNVLNQYLRKTLCNSLIQCLFDYSCSSWYYSLSKSLKLKLQVTQNKVIRFINNSGPRTSVKGNILKELNMLNVEDRVSQMTLNHVHKICYNKCPSYLKDHFTKISAIHNYNTKGSSFNFHVPCINSSTSNTFYYNAILVWNGLPDRIKEIKNHYYFKSK